MGQDLTTSTAAVVMNAGAGTFTVATGKTLTTTNQLLTVTADDYDIAGAIAAGAQPVALGTASAKTMGMGITKDVTIAAAALQRPRHDQPTGGAVCEERAQPARVHVPARARRARGAPRARLGRKQEGLRP